jgi:hypothetical protein
MLGICDEGAIEMQVPLYTSEMNGIAGNRNIMDYLP